MKKLAPFLFLVLLFSCENGSSKIAESGNVLENFSFTVDTVVVNSGESLFNLKGLSKFETQNYFSVSSDLNRLYFFDRHRLILQEVDINSLTLINTYPFEEEGPNGVGNFVFTFRNLPSGDFFAKDLFGGISLFTISGKRLQNITLNGEDLLKETRLEPSALGGDLLMDLGSQKLYSLPNNYLIKEIYFAVMDSAGAEGKIFEIPEFLKVFKFNIELKSGGGGGLRAEEISLQKPIDLVILSSSFSSSIYVYSPEGDSLFYKKFSQKLAPPEKDVEVKNLVFSEQEYEAELDKLHSQIEYLDFYWDERTLRYYRFAKKGLEVVNPELPREFDFFLFAYDENLELIGETKIDSLPALPESGFFKDGELWSYVNVDDELGFAVFTFNF